MIIVEQLAFQILFGVCVVIRVNCLRAENSAKFLEYKPVHGVHQEKQGSNPGKVATQLARCNSRLLLS
jgi:hypothetical protein